MRPVISSGSALKALAFVALVVARPTALAAQSFDCAKAATPVETAICASPSLRQADEALARAYAPLAGDPATKASQKAWLSGRDATCGGLPPDRIAACLAGAYRARTAALAPAAPALPSPPAGAATVSKTTVSATADSDALLHVTAPGRFAIEARSRTGVGLQLFDMIAGPGEIAGDAGVRDGRLDLLLDQGSYKLRIFGAKAGQGEAALSVAAFEPAAPADASLLRGGERASTLGDRQSRSYWIAVGADKALSVDVTGRALRDVRAWRDGVELVDLAASASTVEPKPGHAMARLRLEGSVTPGLYLVTAYGGEPRAWTDDDLSQPFLVRVGPPPPAPGGVVAGRLGPSGVARVTLPDDSTLARLDLPEPAAARLVVRRGRSQIASAAIGKASREPFAATTFAAGSATVAEITGLEGQSFRLRALAAAGGLTVDGVGPHVVGVALAGETADEPPATAVFARFDAGRAQVVAAEAVRIGVGQAWRRRFNLRGPTSLIVEIVAAGPVAAQTSGVGARVSLEPLLGRSAPRADGQRPRQWDVEAGFYMLRLEPVGGAVGVLDLTFGQPGLAVDPAPRPSRRDGVSFGVRTFERGATYQMLLGQAPALVFAPFAKRLPVDLGQGPLTLPQAAKPLASATPEPLPPPAETMPAPAKAPPPKPGAKPVAAKPLAAKPLPPKSAPVPAPPAAEALTLPVATPPGGRIAVVDAAGAPVPFTLSDETAEAGARRATLTIPAVDAPRLVTIAWTGDAAPEPLPPLGSADDRVALAAGTPAFVTLADGERRGFRLDALDGGLYRIETLGRLKAAAAIGTRFLPKLDAADDNGPGHNALLQTFLRAGSYRLDVTASDSAGRLGVVARKAELVAAGALVAGGSVRATLGDGRGAAVPIEIAQAGDYRLDLYGLDRTFSARLEDAEGWPLAAPGELRTLTRRLEAGRYRLVVLPPEVEAQMVARLRRVEPAPALEGHGPHDLPFDAKTAFQWREPAAPDAARTPDRWTFALQGDAHVVLSLGDGMGGELIALDDHQTVLARVADTRPFKGLLPAGRYALDARALGRNDRLDYTIELRADELQPGRPRFVELPATIPFAIARDRVASLTTFGDAQLIATLKDGEGRVVERLSGRADDWNVALSRRLPAGAYALELAALETPAATPDSDGADNPDDPPQADDAPSDDDAAAADEDDRDKIEVRLALPEAAALAPLALTGDMPAKGASVSRFELSPVEAGALLIVGARSDAELVVSLARRDASAQVVGFARGKAPVLAAPGDGGALELSVWPVDGGDAAATVFARAVSAGPAIVDAPTTLAVARIATPGRALLDVAGPLQDAVAGSAPGRALAPFEGGLIAPQGEALWIVAPAGANPRVEATPVAADRTDLPLALEAGDVAALPTGSSGGGTLRVWRADATDGQPGFLSAAGAGVARSSALALADPAGVRVWNAGAAAPLRVRVTGLDLAHAAGTAAPGAIALAARSAKTVALPVGPKGIGLRLPAGAAAVLSGAEATQVVWAADAAVSRELSGAWSQALLINTTAVAAAAALDAAPAPAAAPLSAGQAMKRFFGAAGSFSLAVAGPPVGRLTVAGGEATFLAADGRVSRGAALDLPGPGVLTVDHPAGLVVAAIESGGATPWTAPPAVAAAVPSTTPMEGAAMARTVRIEVPSLLRVRTTAPVILSFDGGDPEPMPLGADVERYVAQEATLRLFSPSDGPLSGALDLSARPVAAIGEGIGVTQIVSPGGSALFAFQVTRTGLVGAGVRADPDRAEVRLLDAAGKPLGEGASQMRRLEPGRYLIEARAPADGPPLTVRPAVVGIEPRPDGPPPDVAKRYLELVGTGAPGR